jgi:membrane fusion protein, multidrug efflux system
VTRRRRIGLAILAVAGAFAAYQIATSFIAYTGDAYVRSDLVALAPEVTGRIISVHVADNQEVVRGDLLALIDPVPFQLDVDQHRAEMNEAQAQVAADEDSIASAKASLTAATAAATYAHQTQARLAALASDQFAARAELQKADDDMRQADAAVEAAQAAIERAEATLAMHQAAQARATAALGTAAWRLTRTRLTAPVDGSIINLTIRPGDTAEANRPLVGIVDSHAWRIIANFKQSFISGFVPGDTAWIWLDSHPWHLYRARIEGIARGISRNPEPEKLLAYVAPTTDWIRLQRRFPVTLTLVDPPADLKLYMGADSRVLILP